MDNEKSLAIMTLLCQDMVCEGWRMKGKLPRFRSDEKSNPSLISNCDSSLSPCILLQVDYSFRGRDLQVDTDVKSRYIS